MIIFGGRTYLTCHITIPKIDDIDKSHLKIYNCQSLNPMIQMICLGNGKFFYFNYDGKLELYHIQKTVDKFSYLLFLLNALN